MSADERREAVVRAAMTEFARGGYEGTSTAAIAARVGVSQPYLFRLYPNKRAIFLAAAVRCVEDTRLAFERVAEGLPAEEVHDALAVEYSRLLADRDRLMMQMQVYVAVNTAAQDGDEEFGDIIRAAWEDLWDSVHLLNGADEKVGTTFMAFGMLINTLAALGFPNEHRVWDGFDIAKPRV